MVTRPIFSPGRRCGATYDITERIEQGPISETYTAIHRSTRATALIACSRFTHVQGDPPSADSFIASVEKLRRLAIDRLPKIYDCGVHEGVYWVASQILNDITILEMHARIDGKVYESRILDGALVILSVQSILRDAWSLGVTHGNLRPSRILLRGYPNESDPHLVELGFADLFMMNREAACANPRYRPPEQLEGAPFDARSDIYSLGMCLYHLIAKAPPYSDKVPESGSTRLLELALRHPPTPLPSLVDDCPAAAWSFVAKAIEKDPSKRFQSHDEFNEALDALTDQLIEEQPHSAVSPSAVRALARALGAKVPDFMKSKLGGLAKDGDREPSTVPPGADTKRRIKAALTQARASVEQGLAAGPIIEPKASKASKAAAPSRGPSDVGAPSTSGAERDPESDPVTLPSAHPGHQTPQQSAHNAPRWVRPVVGVSAALLTVSGLSVALSRLAGTRAQVAQSCALGSIAIAANGAAPTLAVAVAPVPALPSTTAERTEPNARTSASSSARPTAPPLAAHPPPPRSQPSVKAAHAAASTSLPSNFLPPDDTP